MSAETQAQAKWLIKQLGGSWHGHYGLCRCPVHQDRSPSLRIAAGQTNILVHCFAGCDRRAILTALPDMNGAHLERATYGANRGTGPPSASPQLIQRLWAEGRPIEGTCAERYLDWRGISGRSRALRFHPRMFAGPRANGVSFPALMAAIETDEGVIALQRTFLTADGRKALIAEPRRTLGSPGYGAIRLSQPDAEGQLGLAEGTETALSAADLHGLPVWATAGTEGFGKVAILERVRDLHLFLDNGAGGDRAEALIRARSLAATIHVHRPPAGFGDWNDVAQAASDREGRGREERARH